MVTSEYMTVKDAARAADVCELTIRNWMKSGKLTRYQRGYRVLIDAAELDALLKPTVQE